MELTSRHEKRYGQWAGNPNGHEADPKRCAASVFSNWYPVQCGRRRGYGPEQAYCKQHAKRYEAKE